MNKELVGLNLDIGPKPPLQLKNILIPTDFSPDAVKALHYGVRLAQQFGASVTVLHVFAEPEFGYDDARMESMSVALDMAKQECRRHLEGIRKGVEHCYQLSAEAVFCEGSAYEQISEKARERKADLIVISTHGFTGVKRLVHMGSTAERVVRYAPCPVLVVRESEHDFVP